MTSRCKRLSAAMCCQLGYMTRPNITVTPYVIPNTLYVPIRGVTLSAQVLDQEYVDNKHIM